MGSRPAAAPVPGQSRPPRTLGAQPPSHARGSAELTGDTGRSGRHKAWRARRGCAGAAVTSAHTPRPYEEAVLPPPLCAAGAGSAPPPTGGCGGLPAGPGPVLREGRDAGPNLRHPRDPPLCSGVGAGGAGARSRAGPPPALGVTAGWGK
ncbi:cuticle collagen 1-like [Poecile atricapillus]|uniref:cuticle collagen 1-like n=1 Tax=Poecile atricapillus TaxID=48891 RepID=UPI0027385791|nr:cuticle collagen 1-like [Poecile atricapillus]